jgi:hypothetical protein
LNMPQISESRNNRTNVLQESRDLQDSLCLHGISPADSLNNIAEPALVHTAFMFYMKEFAGLAQRHDHPTSSLL